MGGIVQALTTWWSSRVQVDERGANLVEYAMLASLIAVVCMTAVAFFGTNVASLFSFIVTKLS